MYVCMYVCVCVSSCVCVVSGHRVAVNPRGTGLGRRWAGFVTRRTLQRRQTVTAARLRKARATTRDRSERARACVKCNPSICIRVVTLAPLKKKRGWHLATHGKKVGAAFMAVRFASICHWLPVQRLGTSHRNPELGATVVVECVTLVSATHSQYEASSLDNASQRPICVWFGCAGGACLWVCVYGVSRAVGAKAGRLQS